VNIRRSAGNKNISHNLWSMTSTAQAHPETRARDFSTPVEMTKKDERRPAAILTAGDLICHVERSRGISHSGERSEKKSADLNAGSRLHTIVGSDGRGIVAGPQCDTRAILGTPSEVEGPHNRSDGHAGKRLNANSVNASSFDGAALRSG